MSQESDLLHGVAVRVAVIDAEQVGTELIRLGAGGIEERPHGQHTDLVTYWILESQQEAFVARVQELREQSPQLIDSVRRFRVQDTSQAWLEHLKAERLTQRFWVVPEGMNFNEQQGEPITLFVRSAFGFGEHVTTRLAAQEVERRVRSVGPCDVLDIGTGTGILCLVAARSGARLAVGVDCDEAAVAVARDNAEANQVAERCQFVLEGTPPDSGAYDVVVCNIAAPYLKEHAGRLCARVAARGALVLTGFLTEDAEALLSQYEALGMVVNCRTMEAGWGLLAFIRPPD